jgi:hypothetical protein
MDIDNILPDMIPPAKPWNTFDPQAKLRVLFGGSRARANKIIIEPAGKQLMSILAKLSRRNRTETVCISAACVLFPVQKAQC